MQRRSSSDKYDKAEAHQFVGLLKPGSLGISVDLPRHLYLPSDWNNFTARNLTGIPRVHVAAGHASSDGAFFWNPSAL